MLVTGELGEVAGVTFFYTYTIAVVNLRVRRVTEVLRIEFPEISDQEKAGAIEIAQADPMVQELLDKGGTIDKVISLSTGDVPIILKVGEEGETVVEGKVPAVVIVLDNQRWRVLVDLDKGEVDRILGLGIKGEGPSLLPIIEGETTERKVIKPEGHPIPPEP